MSDDERSPDGTPILHHESQHEGWEPPTEEPGLIQAMEQHMERCVGESAGVFHELLSHLVHLDVHQVPPSDDRPFWVVYTTGMSGLPMTVPPDFPDEEPGRRAELVMALPSDWLPLPVEGEGPVKIPEDRYWPIGFMKMLARLPHEYATWLGSGHTVPNGDPPDPLAPDTGLCGVVMLPPAGILAQEDWVLRPPGEPAITLLTPTFLHADELDLKLGRGLDALLDKLDAGGVGPVLDPARPSTLKGRDTVGKPWWKLW